MNYQGAVHNRLFNATAVADGTRALWYSSRDVVRGPGLTLIFVPVQQMVRVSLRTVTMQIPSQKIITKDNVSIDIAVVAY